MGYNCLAKKMKRLSLLFCLTMMAGGLVAQIEEFDANSFAQQNAKKVSATIFNKQQYPLELRNDNDRAQRPYNLLGHQLYCVRDRIEIGGYQPIHIIAFTLTDNGTVGISKIQKGAYYDVVDILTSESEKTSLTTKLSSSKKFVGDTIHYLSIGGFGAKKEKVYTFQQKDIQTLLSKIIRYNRFDHAVIYVLKDKTGKLYYIWFADTFRMQIAESEYLSYGVYANINNFISVTTYNHLKAKYEGKEIVVPDLNYNNPFYEYINEHVVYTAQKIILKDDLIALTYNKNDQGQQKVADLKYYYWAKLGVGKEQHANDSILALEGFVLRSEADSILAKWDKERLAELAKDEERKQEIIKKYGQKYGQDIIEGKATIGMSKEMCKLALGYPDDIAKRTSVDGNIEVWTYSRLHYHYPSLYPIIIVTFVNDKVSSVDEYKDGLL